MIVVDLSLMGKVNENVKILTFRNKASFGIRKVLREKAYTMAIDIVIKSVDYNLYENSKANPSIQFYGYCVLVFQDMTSIEIPIHFPRQRLYYAIQHEAFRQWRGYVNHYEQYLLHRQTGVSLELIMAAFEIPPVEIEYQLAKTQWIELPLREVYIKCQKNTQFQIEYTAWNPIEFTDPYSGDVNDGKSNQEDGDKDDGLPKDGIQPNRNSPNNPFGNNPPPSSLQEMGQKGFDDLDDSTLGDIDPDNIPTPPPVLVRLQITWNQSCRPSGQTEQVTRFFEGNILSSDLIIFTNAGLPPCFQDIALVATNNRTGAIYGTDGSGVIYSVGGNAPAVFTSNL